MKKFIVELKCTTYVHLIKTIKAKNADEARRTFVNRIGNWESTMPTLLPDIELADSILPNRDFDGGDINIEELE